MKQTLRYVLILVVIITVIFLGKGTMQNTALAQTGGPYDLTWNTFDGGGMIGSSGGSYLLSGTIGQHDAAGGPLSGGVYSLVGGFWASILPYDIFLPITRK